MSAIYGLKAFAPSLSVYAGHFHHVSEDFMEAPFGRGSYRIPEYDHDGKVEWPSTQPYVPYIEEELIECMRGYHFATFDNPGTMRYIEQGMHVFVVNVICPQTGDYWSEPGHAKAVCRQYVPAYYLDEKDVDEFIDEYYTFRSYRCRYVHEIETEFKKRFRLPKKMEFFRTSR
jgi:hypothetical protein